MSWKRKVPFADLYEIPSKNGLTKPSKVRGQGFKMINMGELFGNDRIYDIPMELVPLTETEKAKNKVEAGDLLFARQSLVLSGAGKCSVVMEVSPLTVFESHLIRVRLDKTKANPMFYFYYFASPISPIKSIISQGVQAGIRATDLAGLAVDWPDIDTQNTIAGILAKYDDLIENNQKQIRLLEEAAERLYKEWFVDLHFPEYRNAEIIGQLPQGWHRGKVSEIAEFKRGKTITKAQIRNGDVPVVAGGLEPAYYNNVANTKAPVITVSGSGANAGFTRIYHQDIWASDCSYIDGKNNYIYFIYEFLKCNKQKIDLLKRGSAQPHVYAKDLNGLELVIPTTEYMSLYCDTVKVFFQKIKQCSKQINVAKEARDRLIPKLLSGEIEL